MRIPTWAFPVRLGSRESTRKRLYPGSVPYGNEALDRRRAIPPKVVLDAEAPKSIQQRQ